jgi:hypothetical protein
MLTRAHQLRSTTMFIAMFIAIVVMLSPLALLGQSTAQSSEPATVTERDGSHDFDFQFGRWKVHNRRLNHPLTPSNDWTEFDATVVSRPLWNGQANLDEYHAETPSGPIEAITVRMYNAEKHSWSLYWATQKSGEFALPPTVGKFQSKSRGEFYDHEVIEGKNVVVRFLWLVLSPDKTRWEQAFSFDGGSTWQTNWVMTSDRIK